MGKKQKKQAPKTLSEGFPANLLANASSKLAYQQPEQLHESIWTLKNFLSDSECRLWINYMDSNNPELFQQRGTRYLAARECYRSSCNDQQMAARIFGRFQNTQLYNKIPEGCVACNPNIRLYKYEKGMSFSKHFDDSQTLENGCVTRWTVLIYLSACNGGATSFESNISVDPVPGMLLIHKHGDDCLEHEADPVESGTKYVLRTDLVYAR